MTKRKIKKTVIDEKKKAKKTTYGGGMWLAHRLLGVARNLSLRPIRKKKKA